MVTPLLFKGPSGIRFSEAPTRKDVGPHASSSPSRQTASQSQQQQNLCDRCHPPNPLPMAAPPPESTSFPAETETTAEDEATVPGCSKPGDGGRAEGGERAERGLEVEEEEEGDVCRICRNPGDAENPLRYPCACSGSIKYVHQDCLLQWLNHSNARSCEVN